MTNKNFQAIAAIVNTAPLDNRQEVAEHFASTLSMTFQNFTPVMAEAFVARATTGFMDWQEGWPQWPTSHD